MLGFTPIFFILACLFCNQQLLANRAVDVGNGGDVVICAEGHNGIVAETQYTLDYMFARANFTAIPADLSISKVIERMIAVYPGVGQELAGFIQAANLQILSRPNLLSEFIWRPANLIDITDENLLIRLPSGCYVDGDVHQPRLKQAVIQDRRNVSTVFRYDQEILSELRRNPIQYSFLLVHEWLWKYSDNAVVLRDLNSFLHSTEFFQLDESDVRLVLRNLGFQLQKSPIPHYDITIDESFLAKIDEYEPATCKAVSGRGFSYQVTNEVVDTIWFYIDSADGIPLGHISYPGNEWDEHFMMRRSFFQPLKIVMRLEDNARGISRWLTIVDCEKID
ncbi:MAG: hypothetical protein HRU19_23450 [Pseudobacteriovorax sp.]|nr:hypothetical protein [Pseudobacteriovorax sp.]